MRVDMHGVEICAPVECQVCGRQVATRPDGSIRNHLGYDATRCPGSTHRDPVVRAVNAIANFKIGKP